MLKIRYQTLQENLFKDLMVNIYLIIEGNFMNGLLKAP